MSVIRIDPKLAKKFDVHELVGKSILSSFVIYCLDRNYKKSVELKPWIEEQVKNPTPALLETASLIKSYDDYDLQVIEILKYVQKHLTYKGDKAKWNTPEKWSTANETITASGYYEVNGQKVYYNAWEGDCEDGAILIYVLSRIKGIPANRLGLMAGDVVGGGHAWCSYRPSYMPLNWVFLDWCYWFTSLKVNIRNIFYVDKKNIREFCLIQDNFVQKHTSNYKNIWFVFNENMANTEIAYNFRQVK